jgi:hypothetical protein
VHVAPQVPGFEKRERKNWIETEAHETNPFSHPSSSFQVDTEGQGSDTDAEHEEIGLVSSHGAQTDYTLEHFGLEPPVDALLSLQIKSCIVQREGFYTSQGRLMFSKIYVNMSQFHFCT